MAPLTDSAIPHRLFTALMQNQRNSSVSCCSSLRCSCLQKTELDEPRKPRLRVSPHGTGTSTPDEPTLMFCSLLNCSHSLTASYDTKESWFKASRKLLISNCPEKIFVLFQVESCCKVLFYQRKILTFLWRHTQAGAQRGTQAKGNDNGSSILACHCVESDQRQFRLPEKWFY